MNKNEKQFISLILDDPATTRRFIQNNTQMRSCSRSPNLLPSSDLHITNSGNTEHSVTHLRHCNNLRVYVEKHKMTLYYSKVKEN